MYRALYRKWRPRRFEDVVGQRAIVTALKNQVAANRVGHAYLFTGVRGTGKTTCAKIFAKAVNCLTPRQGDPCGECVLCRGIDNGSILDIVEMDAASNNGVDDIRDLRDETAYTPSVCRYKVYIIDEVHMLSTAAFNALLKTLEEPPSHVIFILATTEIQKVPATILSRCQRYDFTRIVPEDIAGRVAYIAQQENLQLTPEGAELISRLADGALRDALSILDTCAGVTSRIDAEVVRRMAGVTDRSYLFRISDAIAARDSVTALAELAQLRQRSIDVKRLSEELISHYRCFMLANLPGGQSLLSGVSPEEEALYLTKARQVGQGESIRAIRALGNALEKMTRGNDQRIELELALFALTEPIQPQQTPIVAQPARAVPIQTEQTVRAKTEIQPFVSAPVVQKEEPMPQPEQEARPLPAEAVPPWEEERRQEEKIVPEREKKPVFADVMAQPVPAVEDVKSEQQIPMVERVEPNRPFGEEPPPLPLQERGGDVMPPTEREEIPLPEPPPEVVQLPWDELPPPTDFASLPVVSEKPLEAPAKSEAKPSLPRPQNKPQNAPVQGCQVFDQWGEVLKRLQSTDVMLYGYLRKTKAYCDGTRVLIDGGKMFRDFIRANKGSQRVIKKLIFEVSGTSYPIGPYEPRAVKASAVNAEDSLLALQKMGLEVEIRDTAPRKNKKS